MLVELRARCGGVVCVVCALARSRCIAGNKENGQDVDEMASCLVMVHLAGQCVIRVWASAPAQGQEMLNRSYCQHQPHASLTVAAGTAALGLFGCAPSAPRTTCHCCGAHHILPSTLLRCMHFCQGRVYHSGGVEPLSFFVIDSEVPLLPWRFAVWLAVRVCARSLRGQSEACCVFVGRQ